MHLTPAPGALLPSSGLRDHYTHMHILTQRCTHTQLKTTSKIFKNGWGLASTKILLARARA